MSELEEVYRQATLRGVPMLYLLDNRPANRPHGLRKARFPWAGVGLSVMFFLGLVLLFF